MLPVLRGYYPREFDRYFEPFAGSAAVYFDLDGSGLASMAARSCSPTSTTIWSASITSLCGRLDEVIDVLRGFDQAHRADPAAHYYRVRDAGSTRSVVRCARNTRDGGSTTRRSWRRC